MDAERQEDEIRDAQEDLARGGEEMEARLDELDGEIDEAKQVARQRQDAPEKARESDGSEEDAPEDDDEDVAGDWRASGGDEDAGDDAAAQAEIDYELGERGGAPSGDDADD